MVSGTRWDAMVQNKKKHNVSRQIIVSFFDMCIAHGIWLRRIEGGG